MNKLKFLGTAGARFVVIKQVRKSGGLWLTLDDTNVLIDPGPGSLIRCLSSKPKLNPMDLDGIILTHRHIDHSNDINIIIEAMTNGGMILKEKGDYVIGNIKFSTPVKHIHGVETYGLNFYGKNSSISLVSDTKYFNGLESFYKGDVLILNVVLTQEKQNINHLSLADAEKIISINKPKLCILTHFGMNVLREKPWEIADHFSEKFGVNVIAASDGMEIKLDNI